MLFRSNGIMPIYEPGLEDIVKRNVQKERLFFRTKLSEVVNDSDAVFIAVGTPPDEDGSADLKYVIGVAREIGQHLNNYTVVITKSTVPVGTAKKVKAAIQEELDKVTEQVASGKSGKDLELPHIFAKPEKCVEHAGFANPYAKAKALAALHMAEKVAQVNFPACFMLKEIDQVCLTAAAGHEIMGAAAQLATQAREIEKSNDTVFRQPHAKNGTLLKKTRLYEKPE